MRRRIAEYAPVTLLCMVTLWQMVQLNRFPERARWKGGGFGMYSELYSLRHFCRFDDDRSDELSREEYQAAVREFMHAGREERIDLLFADLQRRGQPIEQIIVARKRLERDGDQYRVGYVRGSEYPPAAEAR